MILSRILENNNIIIQFLIKHILIIINNYKINITDL